MLNAIPAGPAGTSDKISDGFYGLPRSLRLVTTALRSHDLHTTGGLGSNCSKTSLTYFFSVTPDNVKPSPGASFTVHPAVGNPGWLFKQFGLERIALGAVNDSKDAHGRVDLREIADPKLRRLIHGRSHWRRGDWQKPPAKSFCRRAFNVFMTFAGIESR
jgi:hypothetical protein